MDLKSVVDFELELESEQESNKPDHRSPMRFVIAKGYVFQESDSNSNSDYEIHINKQDNTYIKINPVTNDFEVGKVIRSGGHIDQYSREQIPESFEYKPVPELKGQSYSALQYAVSQLHDQVKTSIPQGTNAIAKGQRFMGSGRAIRTAFFKP